MLSHHRKPVSLSWISTDLPVWSTIKTVATLEQKDLERFTLLLTEPPIPKEQPSQTSIAENSPLLWIEISPYRVTLTRQAKNQLNYRHFWELGVYGVSRYWLNNDSLPDNQPLHFRNFTRCLLLIGRPVPQKLRVEYELWSGERLGKYVLNLKIHN